MLADRPHGARGSYHPPAASSSDEAAALARLASGGGPSNTSNTSNTDANHWWGCFTSSAAARCPNARPMPPPPRCVGMPRPLQWRDPNAAAMRTARRGTRSQKPPPRDLTADRAPSRRFHGARACVCAARCGGGFAGLAAMRGGGARHRTHIHTHGKPNTLSQRVHARPMRHHVVGRCGIT
eukprot:2074543-Prymnesium_polylepis.1